MSVPATLAAIASGSTGLLLTAAPAGSRVVGYSIRETTGSAAAVAIIRDGTDNTGTILAEVDLAAGTSITVPSLFSEDGIRLLAGLYIDKVSGSTEGSVWVVR